MRKYLSSTAVVVIGLAALLSLATPVQTNATHVGRCSCADGTSDEPIAQDFCLSKSCTEATPCCTWSATTHVVPPAGPEVTAGNETNGAEITAGGPLGNGKTVTLSNPLGQGNVDVKLIIGRVIRTVLGIVGSIALIIFVYGGLLWTTSAGNAEQVKKGTDTLLWATIGMVIIFTSYTLVSFLLETITQTS